MKTVHLRADTLDELLAGLPFVGRDEDGNPRTHDHAAGWDLDLIAPGSIITETRPLSPDEDPAHLDLVAVSNPQADPDAEQPAPGFIHHVVMARDPAWHANLLLHPHSTVETQIDDLVRIDPPVTPQRLFLR